MSQIAAFTLALAICLTGVAPAAEHVITQKNSAFSEAELKIKPGDTVIFKNDDTVPHNVFSASKAFPFNSNVQLPGESAPIPFKQAGSIEVRCVIHPNMKLMVEVKK